MFKLAAEATRCGLNFRWLTLDAGHSSYLYRPLQQSFQENLSTSAKVQILAQAMSLESSGRHDEVFFSDMNEMALRRAVERWNPSSFQELRERFARPSAAEELELSPRQFELATHVRASVERLAAPLILNAARPEQGATPEALAAGLQMHDVLARPQIWYLWLPATLERVTARTVARLVMHQLVAAAKVHQGPRVPAVVVIDEFQEVIGADTEPLLKQARDKSISFWMAHQQLDDLYQGQRNYLATVTGNIALQIHFRATDTRGREHLIGSSGETIRTLRSVSHGQRSTEQEREVIVERLSREDIVRLNADPDLAAAYISPCTALCPFQHIFLMRTGFCMGRRAFEGLRRLPWPAGNRFTVKQPVHEERHPAALPPETGGKKAGPGAGSASSQKPKPLPPPAPVEPRTAASSAADQAAQELESYLRQLREEDEGASAEM